MDSLEGNLLLYKLFYIMTNTSGAAMKEDSISNLIGNKDICTSSHFHFFIQRLTKSKLFQ